MRRFLMVIGLAVAISAIVAQAVLAADPLPSDFKNAAKYCKAVRESMGVDAFRAKYGTNKNKMNAFGKCVSTVAKAKAQKREDAQEKADDAKATAECKKQQKQDAAKFAKDYKNFGQCVKAAQGEKDDDDD